MAAVGDLLQWALLVLFLVMLAFGVDVETLVQEWTGKALMAWGAVNLIMQTIGNITRESRIDAEQVLPGVRSAAVGKVIKRLRMIKSYG